MSIVNILDGARTLHMTSFTQVSNLPNMPSVPIRLTAAEKGRMSRDQSWLVTVLMIIEYGC